jgi:hypothetical protein
MQARGFAVLIRFPVVLSLGFFGATITAGAGPAYIVSATDVTMPLSGSGSSQYTVSGIPMTGDLTVTCQYASTPTEARIPDCSYGPLVEIPVTAGQKVTGSITFYPYGAAVPLTQRRMGHAPAAGLALSGGLLLGLSLRRRAWRRLGLAMLALGVLAGVSGCVANPSTMTPGSYQYTITAANGNPLNGLVAGASTTISVTVP